MDDRALPIPVSDGELADLRRRLDHTRRPSSWPPHSGNAGLDADDLQRLLTAWTTFDWRVAERRLAALPWRISTISGTPVRYLFFQGEHDASMPIVLSHGWPSTVLELVELAERLASPSRYGGRAQDAFTVVVPALPGFPGSPQRPDVPTAPPTHELWHRLLHDDLGFTRYGAHGGDLGAGITSLLGQTFPDAVVGIHLLAVADPPTVHPDSVTPDEQAYLDHVQKWFDRDGGYEHQQMTRPLTLAQGLSDSPAGLLAWLLEKYRDWSDHENALTSPFTDDFVLTQVSWYWFTNSISTSFRPYWEYHESLSARVTRVDVPTAVAVFPHDLAQPPRSWAQRTYRVTRYTTMPRGGHFAAHEVPDLLADDIVEFFGALREPA